MPAATRRSYRCQDASVIEKTKAGQVARRGRGLGHGGTDVHQPRQGIAPGRTETHGLRGIHKKRAPQGHLALELLGNEPIAPCRDFPGDGLGRIAGEVIAQVEKLAA